MVVEDVENETVVVPLAGEIDLLQCPAVRERLHGLIDDGAHHMVLDLSQLHFLDSTALGMLIGLHRRLRDDGGVLELRSPTGPVRRALAVSGLDQVLHITAN